MSPQHRMCATVGGALSKTVAMVLLRTMPRLFTCPRFLLILVKNEHQNRTSDFFDLKIRTSDIGHFTQIIQTLPFANIRYSLP